MSALRSVVLASILAASSPGAVPSPLLPPLQSLSQADDAQLLERTIEQTIALLSAHGIEGIVTGRLKSEESIRQKMQRKGLRREEVLDQRALRIRVASEAECYRVLAALRDRHTEIAGAFDDYIQNPKPNGYRSLHTAMQVGAGEIIEFQVRTHAMHEDAERGAAAHWRYKLSMAAA